MKKYLWDKATDTLTECEDIMQWARMFENSIDQRRVAMDVVGDVTVYTSFLGIDHNFFKEGPPLVFETMCQNSSGHWYDLQLRYSSSKDALNSHRAVVEHLKTGGHPDTFGVSVTFGGES